MSITIDKLSEEVLNVVKGVILHQQPRWSVLVGQRRQFEAWWKHEIITALCSLAYRDDLIKDSFWPNAEVKPRYYGKFASDGTTQGGSVDVRFGRWNAETRDWDRAKESQSPSVWLELKERGTWWGDSTKGLGLHNAGLAHDLVKWKQRGADWSNNDAVFLCHFTTHEGNDATSDLVRDEWYSALNAMRKENTTKDEPPLVLSSPCVCDDGKAGMRSVRLDIFALHRPK